MLRKELKDNGMAVLSVIQAVVTRWNSMFSMLKRLSLIIEPINLVLSKTKHFDLLFSEEEMHVLPDILASLEPFLEITLMFSREDFVTVSLIVPYTTTLLAELKAMKEKNATKIGANFTTCLLAQAERRLLYYEEQSIAR